jgi:translocation and assembly module TamB
MRRRTLALGLGALAIAGGIALALGPGARLLVDHLGDDRRVWRLGLTDLEGVSGASLSDLRVARITLRDEQGVCVEIRDARLAWKPFALLRGRLDIETIDAAKIDILRRPILSAPPPQGDSRDVRIGAIRIARIALAPALLERPSPAALRLSGSVAITNKALDALTLDVDGLDGTPDSARAQFVRMPCISGDARISSPDGGLIAVLAGAPVSAEARIGAGEGEARIDLAGQKALDAHARWSKAGWSGDARADLLAIPALRPLAQRLGGAWTANAEGAPLGERPSTFRLRLASPLLAANATGRIDRTLRPRGAITIDADLDARALSLSGGRIRTSGAFTNAGDVSRYEGKLVAENARVVGVDLSAGGAIDVRADRSALRVRASLKDARTDPSSLAGRLLAGGRGEIDLRLDRPKGVVSLADLSIDSRLINVRGHGRIAKDAPLDGVWSLSDLRAVIPEWRGRGSGTWRLSPAKTPGLTLAGRMDALAGLPEPLDQLVGRSADIDAALAFTDVVRVDRARILSRNLRAAFSGTVDGDALDLGLEATARGPLMIGGARVDGAADVTGSIAGTFSAWSVQAAAQLATLDIGGALLQRARIDVNLVPENGSHVGETSLSALFLGAPLTASARTGIGAAGLDLDNIRADLAGIKAMGAARFTDAGPDASLALSGNADDIVPGLSGPVSDAVRLAATEWSADLAIRNGRYGGDVDLDAARASVAGSYEAPRIALSASGAIGGASPFRLAAAGPLDLSDGVRATLTLDGAVAGAPVVTRRPLSIVLRDGAARIDGALNLGDGSLDLVSTSGPRGFSLDAEATDAPLAAVAISGERLEGRLSGRVSLAGAGPTLTGEAFADVRGFRLARRAREPINARATFALRDGRLETVASARSAAGLSARLNGAMPVEASAAPLRIARRPGGVGEAAWTVQGPVDGLWAVFGPLDQSLTDRVEGQGDLRIEGDSVAGSGALALSAARFEDKATGLLLRDLAAELAFDDEGAVLRKFSARDRSTGKVSGSGRIGSGDSDTLTVDLDDMRILDRADAQAVGDGRVTLAWTRAGMKVGGDVTILSAELVPPQSQAPPPPLIDVVEINRPGGAPRPRMQPAATAIPVSLDLRVRGPRRLFTRGRGAVAEWALDARVTGSPDAPRVFGEARLIRGQVNLVGRPFMLGDGVVTFRGDPLDADVALTAEANSSDITATIRISGRLNDPQIDVSSNPPLPEDEVLPQVLFGANAQDLSPLQAAQLAASLATLAGRGYSNVADAARRAVDLDRLDLREKAGGVLVTGGKYITRDVYLEVSRSALGAASTSVEWQIKPRLFLISSFLANGDQRVSVRWRRTY